LPFLCPVSCFTLPDQTVAVAVRTLNFSCVYHCLLSLCYDRYRLGEICKKTTTFLSL
jgi:hypothetical protein